jgi:hypothetical protein
MGDHRKLEQVYLVAPSDHLFHPAARFSTITGSTGLSFST